MESNRIELAKQAKREARLAAEAANKEEDLEMPIELQQGSGFPGLAARVCHLAHTLLGLAGTWQTPASFCPHSVIALFKHEGISSCKVMTRLDQSTTCSVAAVSNAHVICIT